MRKLFAFFGTMMLYAQVLMAQSVTLATSTANPTKGTVVYNNITNQLQYWNGTNWIPVTNAATATGWAANGIAIHNANVGGVGIGINTPKASLNIGNGKTVIFGLDSISAGNKLIWYGSKGAFRAGYADSTTDYDLIGKKSFGSGSAIEASGESSTALGIGTKAIGVGALATGNFTVSEGQYTTAMGSYSKASSYSATAMGFHTIADRPYMTVVGTYNKAALSALFLVGNGTDDDARSNAVIITESGNVGIGTDFPAVRLQVVGTSSLYGNVGIGTTNPQTSLHVEGTSFLNGHVGIGTSSSLTDFDVIGNAYISGSLGIGTTLPGGKFGVIGNSYLTGNTYHIGNTFVTGNLGIGTFSPIAPVHISTSSSVNEATTRYFSYGTGSNVGVLANGAYSIGLFADYDIVTKNSFVSAQTVTSSDARIKNIVGLSDNAADLNRLRQIAITDYSYKDVVNRGSQVYKKVIAQQVEEVYPEAVKQIQSTIPDIYAVAEKVSYDSTSKELRVFLAKDYNLKAGEKLELVHSEKGTLQGTISDVSGNSFTIKNWPYATDKLFVFGREVNDFRTVDYEALSMLGISAVQQLAKENEDLKEKVKIFEASNRQLNERLNTIENTLSKMQNFK